MNDFDRIYGSEHEPIHIGYISGEGTTLFIKTGQGGSIYGYENKYLDLARRINAKYGYSVFVSATTSDTKDVYETEMQIVAETFGNSNYEMFYFGVSKGGLIGCWYGVDNPKIKRILTVNAPLMINFHNRTLPAIKELTFSKLTMVYGSLDPSYRFVGFVERYTNVKIIEGADHQLKGFSYVYEALATELLIGKNQSPPSSDQF